MRQCNKCKEFKELDQFSPDKRSKDGISRRCKTCAADHAKVYRAGKGPNLKKVSRVQNALVKLAEGADNMGSAAYQTGRYKDKHTAIAAISNDMRSLTQEESDMALANVRNNPKLEQRWKQYEEKVFGDLDGMGGTASEMKDYLKLLHDIRGDIRQKHEITPMTNVRQQQEEILAKVYAASQGKDTDDSQED